jgi:hypothetical protein
MHLGASTRLAVLAAVLAACSTGPKRSDMDENEDQSIACTLTPGELASRREQLLPGLMERAEEVTDIEDGLRMRFESRPGLLAELVGVIDQERTCCSFLRFHLTAAPGTGPVTFEVTGPPGTREMFRAL